MNKVVRSGIFQCVNHFNGISGNNENKTGGFGSFCGLATLFNSLESDIVTNLITRATEEVGCKAGACLAHCQVPDFQQENGWSSVLFAVCFRLQSQRFECL